MANNYVKNKIGDVFGLLTIIAPADPYVRNKTRWLCRCTCGREITTYQSHLRQGTAKSCGCTREAARLKAITAHGQSRSSIYKNWSAMKIRCSNPNHESYPDYGGRGITVCERWEKFENFLADMGERPTPKHEVDRIDNDKGYSPENCRWATRKEQNRNKRDNRFITINNETKCLSEWCEIYGTTFMLVETRLKHGWKILDALTEPPNKNRSRKDRERVFQ